jgi:class 3 adenylate cyclase/tetratricopeptide (TPR) repeat protein
MTDGGTREALDAYIPADRRRALVTGAGLRERTTGTALFADISGFTPLTEALTAAHGPRRGAELLTRTLDTMFGALVDQVERAGGAVVSFGGDAVTVWLDGDDGGRAVACAFAMQQAMDRVGTVDVAGTPQRLRLKVAVAAGAARRFVVGDPTLQRIDVLAGSLLDDVAAAEGQAQPGEVVATPATVAALGDGVGVRERRGGGVVVLDPAVVGRAIRAAPRGADEAVPDDVAEAWLQPVVRERIAAGDRALLAELRRVVSVFVRFGGLDFDADESAAGRLDTFLTGMQRTFDQYGGLVLQLVVGDKGAYVFGAFGTPVAHEDAAARAVAAGLELQAVADAAGVERLQVGISQGDVYSGMYGHPRRRTFSCLGNPVNLAARIMGHAGPGEVLVGPEVRRSVAADADFVDLDAVALKGRAQPVVLSRVVGLRSRSAQPLTHQELPLLGRAAELAELEVLVGPAAGSAARLAAVVGDAGIGKTRLVGELVGRLEQDGWLVLTGASRSFGRTAAYQPWSSVWRALLGLPADRGAAIAALSESVAVIDPALVERAPLLGLVLGLDVPDTDTTRLMDPKVRRDSREDLLVQLLARRTGPPLAVVLEDAHWADPLSLELVTKLSRQAARLRLLVLAVGRPASASEADVAAVPGLDAVVTVPPLDVAPLEELVDLHAQRLFGGAERLHPRLRQLVLDRAQGSPLIVAEVLRYVLEEGVDPASPEAAEVDPPASLAALVLGRIDRLDDLPRRVLKVSSVMTQSFPASSLVAVHGGLGGETEVGIALDQLEDAFLLVRTERGRHDFRHALTREVAYGSLPFELRGRLHQATGRLVERLHAGHVEPVLDTLAHHFWHGESAAERAHYQRRAGAAAKAAYANDAALTYLGRLASVAVGPARADALVERAEVLTLVGRLDEAIEAQEEARTLAEELDDTMGLARAHAGLAESARRGGRFPEAVEHLGLAERHFGALGDDAGRARVLHLTGTVAAQQGDLAEARGHYEAALAIRERTGDDPGRAALLSNLGIVEEYEGDLDASAARHRQALAIRTRVGDPWAIAVSETNLGMIAQLDGRLVEARNLFESSMRRNLEVGDPWMVAVGHHNLANASRDLGLVAGAATAYAAAGAHFEEHGDDWSMAQLLEDLAGLCVRVDDPLVAAELIGSADALRAALDAARPPNVEEQVTALLALIATSQGNARLRRHREAGAARDRAQVARSVSDACQTMAGEHGT